MQSGPSIRKQLRVLVAGVALPLAALAAFTIWTEYDASRAGAEEETDRLAEVAAAAAAQYVRSTVESGYDLAGHADVTSMDPERCLHALTPAATALPHVTNLVVNRPDGSIVCSVIEAPRGQSVNASDRPWVTAAFETGQHTFSPPIEGRISRRPLTSITVPVRDENGEVIGTLGVPLGLDHIQELVTRPLPEGGLLTITDSSRIVIARSLDPETWVLRELPEVPPEEVADLSSDRGHNTATGADGVVRLFAHRTVPGTPWTVWAGVPTELIYAPVFAELYPRLGLALLAILLAFFFARVTAGRITAALAGLGAQMRLVEATAGELVDESGPGEIADVARQYNRLLKDRRQALADAATSTDLRERVMIATNDALWSWDLVTGEITGNRRFAEVYGGVPSPTGAGLEFWTSRVHPEDLAAFGTRIEALLAGEGDGHDTEFRLRRADGTWAEVLDRSYSIHDEEGKPTTLFGAIVDVSAVKESYRVAEKSRERYRSVLRNAAFGIYMSDLDGRLLEANPAFLRMLGVSKPTALEIKESDFYFEPGEWEREVKTVLEKGEIGPVETTWVAKSGRTLAVRIFRTRFIDVSGDVALEVFAEDLTDRQKLEEQFRQAQKMDAVGQLAGGVAHDFNNRLTVIQGRAQLIREEVRDDPELLESIEAILASAEGATKVTRGLLAVSRRQVYQPVPLSLGEEVARLTPMFDTLLGEEISLETRLATGMPATLADPGHVQQILMNLLVNARDAVTEGDKITLRTDRRDVRAGDRNVPAELAPGPYAVLIVEDEGVGMSPEVLERVFEPFFTTKPVGEGTGLGLATVYGLAKQNGGAVRLDSEVGRGTRVEVFLPETGAAAPAVFGSPEEVPSGDGSRVLVVEDEAAVRAVVVRAVSVLGYQPVEASSAEEALELSGEVLSDISVVVTDVVMPGMRGTDMADRLQDRDPDLPVLFISGYRSDSELTLGPERRRGFLPKPFSPHELAQALATLRRRRPAATSDRS